MIFKFVFVFYLSIFKGQIEITWPVAREAIKPEIAIIKRNSIC